MSDEQFHLYIVGTGMIGLDQLTAEAERALAHSRRLLVLDPPSSVLRQLSSRFANVEDLAADWTPRQPRLAALERSMTRVLDAALTTGPIALVVYGHPCVGVFPTERLLLACRAIGLRAKVVAGISCIDAMLIDLGIDPSDRGLQIYDATDALLRRRPIQHDVPCILLDVAAVGHAYTGVADDRERRIRALEDFLATAYPGDHKVQLVRSATTPNGRSEVLDLRLTDIADSSEWITHGTTLVLPPASRRPIANPTAAELAHVRGMSARPLPR